MLLELALISAAILGAETNRFEVLQMRSGHSVRGEVLKENAEFVWVDLGVEVLKLAKKEVSERYKGAERLSGNAVSGGRYGESGHLYATADLPTTPINELVNRFGEAVVLVKTPSGLGSGFLIDEEGHCVTNCHVVQGETRITVDVFQKSGNSIVEKSVNSVEILALSPFFDLALLKLPRRPDVKYQRVFLGFSEDTREGDLAFAVGNPEGLSRSITQGIISNKNRNVEGQLYIQTTAQINPGNSGGPLFNARGQVVGVTNMKRIFSEGLGFAIPVNQVKEFLGNREAFAYNKDNPNTGYRYMDPPRRRNPQTPKTQTP